MGRESQPHPRNAYFFNLLEEKGLSPSEVARDAHVSRQYLGKVRSGEAPVSLEMLYTVVSPFDENVEQVLDQWQSSRMERRSLRYQDFEKKLHKLLYD